MRKSDMPNVQVSTGPLNKGYPCCEACGSTSNPEDRVKYRGRLLCPPCVHSWQMHPEWGWYIFLNPIFFEQREKRAERREKVAVLVSQGRATTEIAALLRVARKTVYSDIEHNKQAASFFGVAILDKPSAEKN